MVNSESGRTSLRPITAYQGASSQPETLPFETGPGSTPIASEDFLYHLSRGSELLKDNQVEPAKEALEIALSLQPRDAQGQSLLGVVYFRLGLYPRAIDIYQKIVAAYPEEITPKVNLALCYVKTGQHHAAAELLEWVVMREPGHQRAWSYLGLAHQFLHDFAKAQAAYERAGQTAMAERMLRATEDAAPEPLEEISPERWELRAAAEDAFSELSSNVSPFVAAEPATMQSSVRGGKWHTMEPGDAGIPEPERPARRPSTPPPSGRPPPLPPLLGADWSHAEGDGGVTRALRSPAAPALQSPGAAGYDADLMLRDWFLQHVPAGLGSTLLPIDLRSVWLTLEEPFAVRASAVALVSPATLAQREWRLSARSRGPVLDEPLGGVQQPIVGFGGPGRLLVRTTLPKIELIELTDETLTVRGSALLGLSLSLAYETESLKLGKGAELEIVRVTGRGIVALALSAPARAISIDEHGVVLQGSVAVGWSGRVLPRSVDSAESPGHARGYIGLSGDGTVLVA